jgi:hypothetical protein
LTSFRPLSKIEIANFIHGLSIIHKNDLLKKFALKLIVNKSYILKSPSIYDPFYMYVKYGKGYIPFTFF